MALSNSVIKQFVEITNDTDKTKKENTVYGTIIEYNGSVYAQIDGSSAMTPIVTTAKVKVGDRVIIRLKDHTATITGNLSDPSASGVEVDEIGSLVTNLQIVVADKVSTTELNAVKASIDTLVADNVEITGRLDAYDVDIENLEAKKAEIDDLKAAEAEIDTLQADYVNVNQKLTAAEADIESLKADTAEIDTLKADIASIENLKADKAEIDSLDTKYANIDFTNIGKAAMEYFYANSGLIENVVVGDQTITGNLVGVTISGDLIEGNTVKADKLVVKGEDGLYYKLNIAAGAVASEEVTEEQLQNGLHGSNIIASTITADKISVTDLVAFDATIGGLNITENSIYSGVKETVSNTTRGIYLDADGQMAIGDADNYLKFYKAADGSYKLDISSESLQLVLTEAAKTATNFLSYDAENGLQIGDKCTGEWSGFRTQITNNGFNILNTDGVVQAKYADKEIQLGADSNDSTIRFGSEGYLKYIDENKSEFAEYEQGSLQVSADKVLVGGKDCTRAWMYVEYGPVYQSTGLLACEKAFVNVLSDSVNIHATKSENIEPDTNVGTWTGSTMVVDTDHIWGLAPEVELLGQYGARLSALSNNLTLGGSSGVDINTTTGYVTVNGMAIATNKVLWSGGWYMTNGHVVTLSEAVSKQAHGIVLVFSPYDTTNLQAVNNDWSTHFVPKHMVNVNSSAAQIFTMVGGSLFEYISAKSLFISDTTINGSASNINSGTANGITFKNSHYILRYVIGV